MARLLAKTAQILVSDETSMTPAALAPLSSWDYDKSCSEIDVTGITDSNKQYLPGQADAKGSFKIIIDPTSTTLAMLDKAHKEQSVLYIYYREQGTGTSLPQEKIPAYITSYKISGSVDARVELDVSWVAAGDIDSTEQASA
jgi:hypothetical protein